VAKGIAATRRQARERAMELLYEADAKDVKPADVLADLPIEPAPFAVDLVNGVGQHQDELDRWISRFARDWALDRMPALDRALLRMGTYELAHRPDVPTGAVISEAVELAQRYSTDDSSRFVNGVLASIAGAVRPEPAPGPGPEPAPERAAEPALEPGPEPGPEPESPG
jgi:transcription antitermination protein NusB